MTPLHVRATEALLISAEARVEHQALAAAGYTLQRRASLRDRPDGAAVLRLTWTRRRAGQCVVVRGAFLVPAGE